MPRHQIPLPLGPIRNSQFLSNHWLEHRLPLEPEWTELRGQAERVLDVLAELWKVQWNRVEKYGDEQGLEHAFIQPVFEALGWHLKYQAYLNTRKPDYALFLDDAARMQSLSAGRTSPDFWKYPVALADAKSWGHNLDRRESVQRRRKVHREYPPQQIERYLEWSHLGYAILTNGRHWRLIPRVLSPDQARFETYLECDLPRILDSWAGIGRTATDGDLLNHRLTVVEDFLRFYLFFSPAGLRRAEPRKSLIERAIHGSSEYRIGIGDNLKKQVFEALRITIEGFLKFGPNALDPQRDLALCHQQSFVLLYRLLFIMFAEDRGLLPYGRNHLYTENRSLRRHRDDIADRLDRIGDQREPDYSCDSTAIWQDLLSLFDIIDRGRPSYDVPAYNGGLFEPDEHPFLLNKRLPDCHLARVIDQLGRAPDPGRPGAGLCRVDYRDLAIQHLGSIYEGLLELQSHYATEPMVVIRKKNNGEERVVARSGPAVAGFEDTGGRYDAGEVYMVTEKGERRATGSYYTPNHIVEYIVQKTLGPVCAAIDEKLQAEIDKATEAHARARGVNRNEYGRQLAKLQADFNDRILNLRVLDPAMGSGHFLLNACQFLAEEIATNPNTSDAEADQLKGDETTLTFWKRRVAEQCLYGVDMNPLAVELAKLALWLETVSVNQPLTYLDHHLRCGNSLVGGSIDSLHVLPGAPPLFENTYAQQVLQRLPVILGVLKMIRRIPSESVEQVKKKNNLYHKDLDLSRRPFLTVADLWCSTFFTGQESTITPDQYREAVQAIGKPAFLQLEKQPWAARALAHVRRPDVAPFHWELEFPEVFFDETQRREEGGFDAVIGNPPYEVLSEKESGRDLAALKAFLKSLPVYAPSFHRKNDLYKLFICRAMELLAEGGRLGFITPMAILGNIQAADLRREILRQGAITSIDAFPQKDDPERRVFKEAKLTTVVFTLTRTQDTVAREAPFTARVHPAQFLCEDSPSLRLTTADIPKYDPANFTIVSCSQADWKLALRIFDCKRQVRLGDVAVSYQGEVNEVTCKEFTNYGGQGQLILRGATVCLYATRDASQGKPAYLDVKSFLRGKRPNTKAFAYKSNRVGFQRMSPQNNFRRLILAPIPAGAFCFDSISYFTCESVRVPLELVMAVFNSKLADWYFRLGSTNATINEYQVNNLPCPAFAEKAAAEDKRMLDRARAAIAEGNWDAAYAALEPGLAAPPFSPAVQDAIIDAVNRIIAIEKARGEIARSARSALAPEAQPLQDFIDRLLYALAGLSPAEVQGVEERLSHML
jgi:hypothetical protein